MKKAARKNASQQRLRQAADDRQRRIRLLLERGLIHDADEIPADAIPIDPERTVLVNIWSPPVYYQDIEFICTDCGKADCWSAISQQYYFEVSKAAPYKRPKRCYDCRQKELARKTQARRDSGHELR
jgi:hypothetical protein